SAYKTFLQADIWRLRADKLERRKLYWLSPLRIVLLAIRRFTEDRCELRASALTFYSLLSIVPVVAMAFGVAKGFGLEKVLEAQLIENFEGQPEMAERILGFARTLLENTKGGAIAGVGVVVLFWSVIKVLGNIEGSFNDIWGIKKARTIGRKLADYLSVMMICPVLLIIASSVTVLLTTQVAAMVEKLAFLGHAVGPIIFLLRLVPYTVIWLLFTFMYVFMPNTKVQIKSGLWGGIVAGTIYQVGQFAYIKFQIGVSNYGAIYGSFAALPLFLVWLQLSWLIVLIGAEISFARQNVAAYEFERDCSQLSHASKRTVALIIAHCCIKAFLEARKPPSAEEIARELEVPIRLVRSALAELTDAKILSEVNTAEVSDIAYQPGCHIDDLTVMKIVDRLDRQGSDAIPIAPSKNLDRLRGIFISFEEANEKSPANLKLQEL
ncbi:MAG TPA: YihY/virulence factor BrkB family protein, partial [Candidatus Binatus sp.]|nr:YihY/virulence factor BrkB family protein [Candidatus Binatus sp.]